MDDREAKLIRIVVANVRRLMPKIWSKRHPNWVAVMEIFATGSGRAWQMCEQAGIDPEAHEVSLLDKKPSIADTGTKG